MEGWWLVALGMVAGTCTTFSFVPQVLKAWREGDTEAISKRMYLVSAAAFSLWVVHGLLIGSWPIVVFNALSLALSGTVLVLKLRARRAAPAVEPGPC
jgi:MtN3 and saliva related transmembrane protein